MTAINEHLFDAMPLDSIERKFKQWYLQNEKNESPEALWCMLLVFRFNQLGHSYVDMNAIDIYAKKQGIKKLPYDKYICIQHLKKSTLVNTIETPNTLFLMNTNHHLYSIKMWHIETTIANFLKQKATLSKPLTSMTIEKIWYQFHNHIVDKPLDKWQSMTLLIALKYYLTIILGDVKTNKNLFTTYIIIILILASKQQNKNIHITLATQTKSLAQRLLNTIHDHIRSLPIGSTIKSVFPSTVSTIYELLIENKQQPQNSFISPFLATDILIVYESSMIDYTMMYQFIQIINPQTHFIMVGDPYQTHTSGIGKVLMDVAAHSKNIYTNKISSIAKKLKILTSNDTTNTTPSSLSNCIVKLNPSIDSSSNSLQKLSKYVIDGDIKSILSILSHTTNEVEMITPSNMLTFLDGHVIPIFTKYHTMNIEDIFEIITQHQIICTHKYDKLGSHNINTYLDTKIKKLLYLPVATMWYHGKPIIMDKNDNTMNIFRGDIGIASSNQKDESISIAFKQNETITYHSSETLTEYSINYASTIQQSIDTYEHTIFILPSEMSPLLNRELIYTVITQTRKKLTIIGDMNLLLKGVNQSINYYTGLKNMLDNGNSE